MPLTLRHLDAGQPRSSVFNRSRPILLTGDKVGYVLAPVYPGWFVVPLTETVPIPPLTRNGHTVTETTKLAFGDRLEIGATRFAVEGCTAADDDATGPPHVPTATALVRFANQTVATADLSRPALVGTDPGADIAVPADTGLAPAHAVIAHVADRWRLFVLDKSGASRFGCEPVHTTALVPGEAIWLSDRVELTLNCAELDPLDLIARSARHSTAEIKLPALPVPAPATASVSRPAEETPASVSLGTAPGKRPQRARSDPNNPAHRAARVLCERLQARHLGPAPEARPKAVTAAPFRSPPPPGAPLAAVEQIEHLGAELESDPWDTDALFALAVLLRQLGLGEFSAWVLAGMRRRNPTDGVVNQSYGVVCREQAADPRLAPPARAALLGRARRYLSDARAVRAHDQELADLIQRIGDELSAPPAP